MDKEHLEKHAQIAAKRYLTSHGYDIVDENFDCPFGKVDFITYNNDTLQFIGLSVYDFRKTDPEFPNNILSSFEIAGREKIMASYLNENEYKDVELLWSDLSLGVTSDNQATVKFHINSLAGITRDDDKYVYHDEFAKQATREINSFMRELGIKRVESKNFNSSVIVKQIMEEIYSPCFNREESSKKIIDDCHKYKDINCVVAVVDNQLRFTSAGPDTLTRAQKEACICNFCTENQEYNDMRLCWDVANVYEKDGRAYIQIDKNVLGHVDAEIPVTSKKMKAIARATKTDPTESKTFNRIRNREQTEMIK